MKKQVIIIAAAVLAVVGINLGLVSGWIGRNLFLRYVKCE